MSHVLYCAGALAMALALFPNIALAQRCANPDREVDARIYIPDEDCEACIQARLFLQRHGMPFRELSIDIPEVQRVLKNTPSYEVQPVLLVCGEWFVGFDENTEHQIQRLFPQPV